MTDKEDRIMRIFYRYPEKRFHIRELSRKTKISPAGVSLIVRKLKKCDLLLTKRHGNMEEVEISRTDKYYRKKSHFNLESLMATGLIEFLRNVYDEPRAIILFGSYSNGTDTSESDIDIAVITNKKKSHNLDLKRFERQLKRKVNLMEIKIEKSGKEFLNNLANGIVLSGYLELLK